MSYKEFANKVTWATGDGITASKLNYMEDGPQDEFEDRMQVGTTNGVISGLTPSIAGTDIAIASGEAYAAGKRYNGSGTVSFSGSDAANTYYIFVDSSDESTPYDKSTSAPTDYGDDLLLASVAWDGSTTLSALVDLRRWGVEMVGVRALNRDTVTTGILAILICERDMFIEGADLVQADNGSAGTTTVDVHGAASGTTPVTIWTTQTRRPYLAHDTTNYTVAVGGEPNGTRKFSKGNIITIEVDEAATGAQDLGVVLRCRYC